MKFLKVSNRLLKNLKFYNFSSWKNYYRQNLYKENFIAKPTTPTIPRRSSATPIPPLPQKQKHKIAKLKIEIYITQLKKELFPSELKLSGELNELTITMKGVENKQSLSNEINIIIPSISIETRKLTNKKNPNKKPCYF